MSMAYSMQCSSSCEAIDRRFVPIGNSFASCGTIAQDEDTLARRNSHPFARSVVEFDRRFPPIGNSFVSETAESDEMKHARRKRRFKSSPGFYPCNLPLDAKIKEQPEPPFDGCDAVELWTDLVSSSAENDKSENPEAFAGTAIDSKLCTDAAAYLFPISGSTIPYHTKSGDAGNSTAAPTKSASGFERSGTAASVYKQSYSLAEKTQQAALAAQQRRARRFSSQAGGLADVTPQPMAPVLLGRRGGTDVAKPPQSIAALQEEALTLAKRSHQAFQEEALTLAKRSHQAFQASQKRRAGRFTTSSNQSGVTGGESLALPALLGHCSSQPPQQAMTQKQAEHIPHEPPREIAALGETSNGFAKETSKVNFRSRWSMGLFMIVPFVLSSAVLLCIQMPMIGQTL